MFWHTRQEKQAKLNNQFQSEFKELLIKMNSNLDRAGLFASAGIGGGYDFSDALHNIFCDFGYPFKLEFSNFWNMYRRFGIAAAVVDTPPDLSWLSPPTVDAPDRFVRDFELLVKKTKLWNRVKGLDKRQRVGRYAGLFIQIKDSKKPSEPVEGKLQLSQIDNLKPIYEGQLRVNLTQNDPTKEGFGNPLMYEFISSGSGDRNDRENSSFQIHPSRVIIAAEGADDGSIYGISSLENNFNDLMDLRKICGAGGEGFYQNTRSAPVINAAEGFKAPATTKEKEALEKEIDDFLSKWQKKFVSKGLEFNYPDIKLDNPKEFYNNSINNVAAGSKIPSAILIGQQMGVRASDKDFELLMITIQSRRENFLNELVTDIVDWFINAGVLENTTYELEWEDLTAASEADKWEINSKKAETFDKVITTLGKIVGDEADVKQVLKFMGFEDIKIDVSDIDDADIDKLQDDDDGDID